MRIDRISSLPDSLLCRILSFQPTTTSVATCVLSRRWRHLWEYLQVFNFDDSFFQPCESPKPRFVDFVNKVLTLRRGDDIQKFSLSCSMFGICDEASMWVRAVIGPHLQEMNISMPTGGLCLPQSLFTCTALVSLTLVGGVEFYLLSSVHLPSLKKLELDVALMYSISKLVSGCPVLETLQVRFELWCGISKLISPSLKSLTFDIPYFDSRLLIGLLRNCCMLQVLIINSWQGTPHQSHEPSCWTHPKTVPTCVMSHLEIFKFGGYHDFADERAFVVYILETGLVLKTMTIHCNTSMDLEEKHDILKGLSMISKGSNMCQLEFD